MNAVWVALIVAVLGPMLKSIYDNRQRKAERAEDRADRAKLVKATEEVKETAAKTESVVTAKLDAQFAETKEIKHLVNSDKTEGLRTLRAALANSLWWMKREAARGDAPDTVQQEIEDTEQALAELDVVLADREKTQRAIDAET